MSPAPHTCSTSCWINCHNGSRNGHLFPAPLTTQTANLLVLRCNQTSACRVLQMQCSSSSTAEKLTKLSRHVLTNLADGYFDGYFDSHSVAKQRLCCASVAHHATAVGLLLVGPKGLPVLQLHRAVEPTPSPGESDTGNRSDVPMENHETYGGGPVKKCSLKPNRPIHWQRCWDMLRYVEICWDMLRYVVEICWHSFTVSHCYSLALLGLLARVSQKRSVIVWHVWIAVEARWTCDVEMGQMGHWQPIYT